MEPDHEMQVLAAVIEYERACRIIEFILERHPEINFDLLMDGSRLAGLVKHKPDLNQILKIAEETKIQVDWPENAINEYRKKTGAKIDDK